MNIKHLMPISVVTLLLNITAVAVAPVGICYGRIANNLPPPTVIVNILKSNSISYLRLFNTDPATLQSFAGTGILLTIGVPNEILPFLASSANNAALNWLQSNVFTNIPANQVRYIAVGNEIFHKDPFYTPHLLPAIFNLHQALQTLGLSDSIKLSTPLAATVLANSFPPSSGTLDPHLRSDVVPLLQFLQKTQSPLMLNVYPYFSYINDRTHVSLDYALSRLENPVLDGSLQYRSLLDANIDALVYAMEREGFEGLPVVVTETGWPTSGGEAANVENAAAYNGNVLTQARNGVGTPRKPGIELEVYLFDLFDENEKVGEEFERHFGIFGVNGVKAYDLRFN
ncbi:hypothetical protein L6164_020633 [Bauhinia variegata]|uniref:Uncharacterized protein n=1 Tax=Bauhinia variegata TaxID=167791 RepID=A0ACB9N0L8_BAUVA|nr:hypothetical protein L6164_020633 [Bauhinia variegata]